MNHILCPIAIFQDRGPVQNVISAVDFMFYEFSVALPSRYNLTKATPPVDFDWLIFVFEDFYFDVEQSGAAGAWSGDADYTGGTFVGGVLGGLQAGWLETRERAEFSAAIAMAAPSSDSALTSNVTRYTFDTQNSVSARQLSGWLSNLMLRFSCWCRVCDAFSSMRVGRFQQGIAQYDPTKPVVLSSFGCGRSWKYNPQSKNGTVPRGVLFSAQRRHRVAGSNLHACNVVCWRYLRKVY